MGSPRLYLIFHSAWGGAQDRSLSSYINLVLKAHLEAAGKKPG